MKNYFVKTRNWHGKKNIFKLLCLSHKWGVQRGDSYTDGDGKFCLETTNLFKAFLTLLYFLALGHWSGGWTYIQFPNHKLKDGCKIFN